MKSLYLLFPMHILFFFLCTFYKEKITDDALTKAYNIHLSLFNNIPDVCLVVQLCPILCDPVDCRPLGPSVHGDSPGKNAGVGCHGLKINLIRPNKTLCHLCSLSPCLICALNRSSESKYFCRHFERNND